MSSVSLIFRNTARAVKIFKNISLLSDIILMAGMELQRFH